MTHSQPCARCKDKPRRPNHAWCRECHAAYMREWRRNHGVPYRDLPPAEKRKVRARRATAMAVRRGKIIREPCDECGSPHAEAHHLDYSDPYAIRWLCPTCHHAHHKKVDDRQLARLLDDPVVSRARRWATRWARVQQRCATRALAFELEGRSLEALRSSLTAQRAAERYRQAVSRAEGDAIFALV